MSSINNPIAIKISFNDSSSSSISETFINPEDFLKSNNMFEINRSKNPTLSDQSSLINTTENSELFSQNDFEYKF